MTARPFPILGLILLSMSVQIPAAFAGSGSDALIVVVQESDSSAVSEQVNSRIAMTSVVQNLGQVYGSLDIVSQAKLSDASVVQAIQKRQSASNVDLMILAPVAASMSATAWKKLHFQNLRMVYLGANRSSSDVSHWAQLGAKVSIGQSDFTSSSSLATQRFAYRWGMGWSAEEAAKDAEAFSGGTQATLGKFAVATARPSLAITGLNIDRAGNVHSPLNTQASVPQSSQASVPALAIPASAQGASGSGALSGFGSAVLAASSSALMPSVAVNEAAVPSPQAFLDKVQPLAWEQMQNLFSTAQSQVPSVDSEPLAQEIWVDGEFLRYILAPVEKWEGGKFASALSTIQGVKLTRSPTHLEVSLYFSKAFDVQFADPSTLSNFQLYSVHVPQTVRIALEDTNGVLSLSGLDDGEGESQDKIYLGVKIPVISNKVYLRTASIELASGNVSVDAGILADVVGLTATAQIFAAAIKPKVDVWKSIEDNESLFDWPLLTFASK
jgi:hypothetical protein